jgi:hypothetical protein
MAVASPRKAQRSHDFWQVRYARLRIRSSVIHFGVADTELA